MNAVLLNEKEKNYIEGRFKNQEIFYNSNSNICMIIYAFIQIIQIFLASMIPLVLGDAPVLSFFGVDGNRVAAVFGVVIAIVSSINSQFQFQRTWLRFRSICERMKNEKYLYLNRVDPYKDENSLGKFVERIEEMDAKATQDWVGSLEKTSGKN